MQLYNARNVTTDARKHQENLALVDAISATLGKDEYFATFPNVFGDADQFNFLPSSPTTSKTVIINRGDDLLIVFGGMTNFGNVPHILNSSGFTAEQTGISEYFPPYAMAWRNIKNQFLMLGARNWNNITLVGYSYGGAVAHIAHAELRKLSPRASIETWSYGAPRFAYTSTRSGFFHGAHYRIWNRLDPVVRLVPHTSEAPLLTAPLGPITRRNWNACIQPIGGLELDSTGTFRPLSSGVAPIIVSPLAIPAWMVGINAFGAGEHALATYIARMARARANAPFQAPVRPPQRGDDLRAPSPTEERRLMIAAYTEQGFAAKADLKQTARDILKNTEIKPGVIFKRASQFSVRLVTYDGAVVSICDGKRHQKTLVKLLNTMLKAG